MMDNFHPQRGNIGNQPMKLNNYGNNFTELGRYDTMMGKDKCAHENIYNNSPSNGRATTRRMVR